MTTPEASNALADELEQAGQWRDRLMFRSLSLSERDLIVAVLRSPQPGKPDREEVARQIWNGFAHQGGAFDYAVNTVAYNHCMNVADAILALYPSHEAPAQEPVAWRYKHSSHRDWSYSIGKPEGPSIHLFTVEPLYAAPASHEATREALAELLLLWRGRRTALRLLSEKNRDHATEAEIATYDECINEFEAALAPIREDLVHTLASVSADDGAGS